MSFAKKYYPAIILGIILLGAIALRTFHFKEWLYFKWDQGRDAAVIAQAYEKGPSYLPLLGPRATKVNKRGDYLRLGPAYFYFQYASAQIFRSIDPPIFAYPDLLFSLAIIPLLYLFFRIYFSKPISLVLVGLYSFSFIIIQYSRFSWNPNSVPFFTVLNFYAMLKATDPSTPADKKIWFYSLWAFAFAIASQLHFFACFSLIGITAVYLFLSYQLWNFRKIIDFFSIPTLKKNKIFLSVFLAIFLVVYSPFIISELKTGGENAVNFVRALTYKPEDKPFLTKVKKNIKEQANHFFLIVTSHNFGNFDISGNRLSMSVGGSIILGGMILSFLAWRKTTDPLRKNFLLLLMVWVVVFGIVCIPMASQLRPRFFVVVFAVPFIFFGLMFQKLEEKFKSKGYFVIAAISFTILTLNLHGTYAWFQEQSLSQKEHFETKRTMILKRKDGVTLGQMKKAIDYMYQQSGGSPIMFVSKTEYEPPYSYLFYLKNQTRMVKRIEPKKIISGNAFFLITSPSSRLADLDKSMENQIEVIDEQQFGQILVMQLKLQGDNPLDQNEKTRVDDDEIDSTPEKIDDRLYWKDVL